MRARMVRWILALSVAALAMGAVLVQAARAEEAAGGWRGHVGASGVALQIGALVRDQDVAAQPGGLEARR